MVFPLGVEKSETERERERQRERERETERERDREREMEVLMRVTVMVCRGGSFTPIISFDAAALWYIPEQGGHRGQGMEST